MSFGRLPREASIANLFYARTSFVRRYHLLRRSPIFAVAGFVGFLFLATLWNWAIEAHYPKLRIRSALPLIGMVDSPPAPVTPYDFMSGAMQKAVSANFGRSLPVFNISVRTKNQFLYSLFHVSGAPGTIVGKQDELYQQPSIDSFCKRAAPPSEARLNDWAGQIRATQDLLDAKGKGFVYLITPTKAATYPQYLPSHVECPALAAGETDKLSIFRAALNAHGVRYVDGPALIADAKRKYPVDLFARGGTHWNLIGGALAAQEITRALPHSPLGQFDFDWIEIAQAQETDRDLLDLLNLLWPDYHYPTAIVRGRANGMACDRPPRMLAIGASFLFQVDFALAQAACAPDIDDYWYYVSPDGSGLRRRRFRIGRGATNTGDPFPGGGDEELRASVEHAELVVLEENESVISTRIEVDDLLRAVKALN